MGTVGISFGSPTSGQGFNVSSTVSQLVANLQNTETPWQNQLSSLQLQDAALTAIGSDLSTLSSALQALTDVQGVFSNKEGSSSDSSTVSLISSSSSAVAGSHNIVVNSLASTSTFHSDAVGSNDKLTGTLQIGIGGGASKTINLGAGETLSDLAKTINNGSFGVTANVVNTGSGQVLSLVSATSGAAGEISLTGSNVTDTSSSGSPVNFTESQVGKDASLTVDGVDVTSPSNTVTTAITGVTLQLLNVSSTPTGSTTPTPVQVVITNDNSDVETAIGKFVSAYNAVMSDVNAEEGKDASGNPEPLFASPTLANIQEQLQQALVFSSASGAVTSLTQLGVSVNTNGTLSLNNDTLDSELTSNYQDVMNFFQSTGSAPSSGAASFGDTMTNVMNNLGNAGSDGAIFLQLHQDSTQESQLSANVSNENTHISAQQALLTTELNQANFVLQEIPLQLQSVNELYSAITGFNQNPQG